MSADGSNAWPWRNVWRSVSVDGSDGWPARRRSKVSTRRGRSVVAHRVSGAARRESRGVYAERTLERQRYKLERKFSGAIAGATDRADSQMADSGRARLFSRIVVVTAWEDGCGPDALGVCGCHLRECGLGHPPVETSEGARRRLRRMLKFGRSSQRPAKWRERRWQGSSILVLAWVLGGTSVCRMPSLARVVAQSRRSCGDDFGARAGTILVPGCVEPRRSAGISAM